MITKEQQLIIDALRDHLEGHPSVVSDGVDRSLLAEIAGQQEVGGILYAQTQLPNLEKAYALCCYQSVQRKQMLSRVNAAFETEKLPYLVFKGPELAKYYPRPELRSMGDMDILVHEADKERAHTSLLMLGCSSDTTRPENHEWAYSFGDSEIELHHRLLYPSNLNEEGFVAFTDQAWTHASSESESPYLYQLTAEFQFIFALLHLRKHLLWAGIGLRQFYDLAVMIRNGSLDWEVITSTLETLGLTRFSLVCFDFVRRWFGVAPPLDIPRTDDSFFEKTTETVLQGGVFGLVGRDAKEEITGDVINSVRKSSHKGLGKAGLSLRVLFPSYESMRRKYPDMAVSRVLLPLLWLRRCIDALLARRAKGGLRAAVHPLTVTNEEIDERERFLKEWGC